MPMKDTPHRHQVAALGGRWRRVGARVKWFQQIAKSVAISHDLVCHCTVQHPQQGRAAAEVTQTVQTRIRGDDPC